MNISQAYLNVSSRLPDDDSIKRRLDRAYDIVRGDLYTVIQSELCSSMWEVSRVSTSLLEDSSAKYEIDTEEKTCTCPDFLQVRSGLCKHRLAVMMVEEMRK